MYNTWFSQSITIFLSMYCILDWQCARNVVEMPSILTTIMS